MNPTTNTLEIQGHRGARGLLPENTVAGFAAALRIGVHTLELDVGISRDGVLMVHHNPTLNPMTTRNSQGEWIANNDPPALYQMSAAQIQTYDVGMLRPDSEYAQRFPEQKPVANTSIPTLREVIEHVQRSGNETVRLNIEAKSVPGAPGLTASPEQFASVASIIQPSSASPLVFVPIPNRT